MHERTRTHRHVYYCLPRTRNPAVTFMSSTISPVSRMRQEFANPGDPPVSTIERHSIDRFG